MFQAFWHLRNIRKFKEIYLLYRSFQDEAEKLVITGNMPLYPSEYQEMVQSKMKELNKERHDLLREQISLSIPKVESASKYFKVNFNFISCPPPVIAGSSPAIPVKLFETILNNPGYNSFSSDFYIDSLNQLIGNGNQYLVECVWSLINPFKWPKVLGYCLRLIWDNLKSGWAQAK